MGEQVILESDLASLKTVLRGSIVTLIYKKGNVQLSVLAEALKD